VSKRESGGKVRKARDEVEGENFSGMKTKKTSWRRKKEFMYLSGCFPGLGGKLLEGASTHGYKSHETLE